MLHKTVGHSGSSPLESPQSLRIFESTSWDWSCCRRCSEGWSQGPFREWWLDDYSEEKTWSEGARTEQGCWVGSWNSTVVRWCTVLKVSCSSGTVGSNSKCLVDVSTDRPSQDVDFRIPTNDCRVRSREVQRRWLMFEIEFTECWTDTKRSPKRPHIVRGLSDLRVLASILLFPVWWVHGRFMYVNQRRHARQRPKQPSKTKSLKENLTLLLRPPAFIPSYIVTPTF